MEGEKFRSHIRRPLHNERRYRCSGSNVLQQGNGSRIGVEHSLNKSLYSQQQEVEKAAEAEREQIRFEYLKQKMKKGGGEGGGCEGGEGIGDIEKQQQQQQQQQQPQEQQQQQPQQQHHEQELKLASLEAMAMKGLKRTRTTNQTYGSWIGDPHLEGKDWYRSPRFPHVQTYLTRHREESGSWI